MKFAFVIFKYFPYGGVQRDMLRMAKELVNLGHSVDILTMKWEGDWPPEGIRCHLLPGFGWLNHQRYEDFYRQALKQLNVLQPDLIVGFNRVPGLDVYFAADPCFEARAQDKRGFLYRCLGRYKSFARFEQAVFDPRGHCEILTLTPEGKKDFQRFYNTPEHRFHTLPPYLSAKRMALQDRASMRRRLRELFGFDEDSNVLLMVGSGFERKGLDRAIRAVAALPQSLKTNTHLLMVGDGRAKVFEQLARVLNVSSNVHISQGRSDVPYLMQGADLLLHPARHEMAGNVLLEAMASGLPVLANAACGYGFHVTQASAGRLIPEPFLQEEFNRLLAHMLSHENLEPMRQAGMAYTTPMLTEYEGRAEAEMLIEFAMQKKRKCSQRS